MTDDERLRQRLRLERRVLTAVESLTDCGWTATTREVRSRVQARAINVDEALRALLSKRQVVRTNDGWEPTRRGRTRLGHAGSRKRSPSGVQASYFKAADKVAAGIAREFDVDPALANHLAREWLREALPARQRARLKS